MRLRITISVIEGSQTYQKEHTFVQFEEIEDGKFARVLRPSTEDARFVGDEMSQSNLLDHSLPQWLERARSVIITV